MGNFGGASIGQKLYKTVTDNIPKGAIMLEFGSGNATKEFSKIYKVYSIEDQKKWINHCKESTYIHAPQINYEGYKWYDIKTIKDNIPEKYDFMLIDGPKGSDGAPARVGFEKHINEFNLDIPMFFDDTHRPYEFEQAERVAKLVGKELITLDYDDKAGCKFSYFI